MAFSAHKDPELVKEHFCDQETLNAQAEQVAQLIKNARHFVCFTGAGVSTSAGIPDFRGPQGVWTMRAQGKLAQARTSTLKACPTATHMSLVSLCKAGYLKFLISQNTDGLHRRSGFPIEKLAELHGNGNLEYCQKCRREYFRDYKTRAVNMDVHDHRTGRKCACGGLLLDTIINFGENLPEKPLTEGFSNSNKADLCMALGSSLTVTPAADMPKQTVRRGGKLIICNLQKTPLDNIADIRVFAKTDEFMTKVMEKLNLQIDTWLLRRYVVINVHKMPAESRTQVTVSGVDADGTPATIFQQVRIKDFDNTKKAILLESEPFVFELPSSNVEKFQLDFCFMGNFNEPPLSLQHVVNDGNIADKRKKYVLAYDPMNRKWETQELNE